MDKNSLFWKIVEGKLPPPPCAATLGVGFAAIDGERGTAEANFEGKPDFLNPAGHVQGGFLAAMLDDTMGLALTATLDAGQFAPTVNLNVQFHRPAKVGPLKGVGRVVLRGREICQLSAELLQNDKIVATANGNGDHPEHVGRILVAEVTPELSAKERAGKAFPVSWDQFHRDCRALTWRLNELGPFHAVIAITRGGLVPAAIVARELGVRVIDTVCIASYDHNKQGELQVLKGISADTAKLGGGTGKGLLIVDDLVDTGKTGRLVRDMMPDAHFATVYAKPQGRPLVDTFITEVSQDTWIFFPWDTALSFQPPIRDGAA